MAVDYLNALSSKGSGLNLREIAASLTQAEIAPKEKAATARIEAGDLSISALGKVRAQFDLLKSALSTVMQASVLSATSGDQALGVVVTDQNLVKDSSTSIDVIQVAKRQVLEFDGFSGPDAPVGAGSMVLDFGIWYAPEGSEEATSFAANPDRTAQTLDLGADATLSELAEALSSIKGVTARVLDKGDGTFSLGIVTEIGAGSALRFSVTEATAGTGLAVFDTTATNADVQIQAASDAVLTVDGITVLRSTNTIDDLIPGVELTLSGATTAATDVIISRDTELAKTAMQYLVEEINTTLTTLGGLTARGLDGSETGALAGDRVAEGLKRQLTALISGPMNGHGDKPVYLSQLGVSTNRDGSLSFSGDRFEEVFAADPARFDAVFRNTFSTPDKGVTVTGAVGSAAQSGSYVFRRDAVTGEATLDGEKMLGIPLEDGTTRYIALNGSLAGLLVTVQPEVTDATVRFGRSFASKLDNEISSVLSSSGAIAEREAQINKTISTANDTLTALETKAEALEKRYLSRFTVMEQVVSQMKSTGEYLTNLIDSWNADN